MRAFCSVSHQRTRPNLLDLKSDKWCLLLENYHASEYIRLPELFNANGLRYTVTRIVGVFFFFFLCFGPCCPSCGRWQRGRCRSYELEQLCPPDLLRCLAHTCAKLNRADRSRVLIARAFSRCFFFFFFLPFAVCRPVWSARRVQRVRKLGCPILPNSVPINSRNRKRISVQPQRADPGLAGLGGETPGSSCPLLLVAAWHLVAATSRHVLR